MMIENLKFILLFLVVLSFQLFAINTTITVITPTSNDKNISFAIDEKMSNSHPELIKLILNTESMDDEERQYWFGIMPTMNDKQIDRLFEILETERVKLEALELKYQEEIKVLNEKHLKEWNALQAKELDNLPMLVSTNGDKYLQIVSSKDFDPEKHQVFDFSIDINMENREEEFALYTIKSEDIAKKYEQSGFYENFYQVDALARHYMHNGELQNLKNFKRTMEESLKNIKNGELLKQKSPLIDSYIGLLEYKNGNGEKLKKLIYDENFAKNLNIDYITISWYILAYGNQNKQTDNQEIVNKFLVSIEDKKRWEDNKTISTFEVQPIFASIVLCKYASNKKCAEFKEYLASSVIPKIKDEYYRELNEYFFNKSISQMYEKYIELYGVFDRDKDLGYTAAATLSSQSGTNALEYGVYLIYRMLQDSNKWWGLNYFAYQDKLEKLKNELPKTYRFDSASKGNSYLEKELLEMNINDEIYNKSSDVYLQTANTIIHYLVIIFMILTALLIYLEMAFRKLMTLNTDSTSCAAHIFMAVLRWKGIGRILSFLIMRKFRKYMAKRLKNEEYSMNGNFSNIAFENNLEIESEALGRYMVYALKNKKMIPLKASSVENIQRNNGSCVLKILSFTSSSSFCFFVFKNSSKENLRHFIDLNFHGAMIIYVKP